MSVGKRENFNNICLSITALRYDTAPIATGTRVKKWFVRVNDFMFVNSESVLY